MFAVVATAEAILAATVAWYADDTHAADPLPARQYVAAGDPRVVAWDCEDGQVTVALGSSQLQQRQDLTGTPTMSPGRNRAVQHMRSAAFELQIVRPAPTSGYGGDPPSQEVLNSHGVACLADVEQVLAMVNESLKGGSWLPEGHGPAPVFVPIIEVLGPTGGLAAIAVTIVIELL